MLTVVVASAAATLKRIALTEPSVTAERASLFSAMSSASARITSATATPATKTKAHKSASPSAEVNLLLTLFVLCLMRSTSRHLSLSLLGLLLPYAPSLVQVHRDRCSWGKAGCIGQSGYIRIVASWRYLRSVCLRRIERSSYPYSLEYVEGSSSEVRGGTLSSLCPSSPRAFSTTGPATKPTKTAAKARTTNMRFTCQLLSSAPTPIIGMPALFSPPPHGEASFVSPFSSQHFFSPPSIKKRDSFVSRKLSFACVGLTWGERVTCCSLRLTSASSPSP